MMDTGRLKVLPWTDMYVRDHQFDQDATLALVEKLNPNRAQLPATRALGWTR
jgi:hypothetical protein